MNLIGLAVYCAVALIALAAMWSASSNQRPSVEARHWRNLALFFGLLMLVRIAGLEEALRGYLREAIIRAGHYSERGEYQIVLALVVLAAVAVAVVVALRLWACRQRGTRHAALLASSLAMLGYGPLYALRILSFHATDRLLYGSPVHLNWLLDAGLSLVAGTSAVICLHRDRRSRR